MLEDVTKLGEFPELGRRGDPTCFHVDREYQVHKPPNGDITFSGFFVISTNPTKFVLFDGRVFTYDNETVQSSCNFCMNWKKYEMDVTDLVQIPHLEMPYGYIEYDDVFQKWGNGEGYEPKDQWVSICPDCLYTLRSICSQSEHSEDVVAGML